MLQATDNWKEGVIDLYGEKEPKELELKLVERAWDSKMG